MKITSRNIINHELIGLDVELSECANAQLNGLKGTVVDETMNMLLVECRGGAVKKIPKASCSFIFTLPDNAKVKVKGSLLVARPEDRVKKVVKRRWQ